MEQLVMRWTNDGSPAVMPQVPPNPCPPLRIRLRPRP